MRPLLIAARRAAAFSVMAVLACQEDVLAPGVCPEFCPSGTLDVRDTILTNVISSDSFFVGYTLAQEASQLQVATNPAGGGAGESRALIVFEPFAVIYDGSDMTVNDTIRQLDSFRILLPVLRRNTDVSGASVVIHRIPITVDSGTTYAAMEPFFADSMEMGRVVIPDTLTTGNVELVVPASALPNFGPDSLQIALGLRIEAASAAFISLPAIEDTATAAVVSRFVQLDSSGVRVTRSEGTASLYDTFVLSGSTTVGAGALQIGGVPAARALLRANLPPRIVDSTQVVRATLLLVPAQAAVGAHGDTFRLRAHAIGADLGPKSPIILEADTLTQGSTLIPVGGSDTLRIDVTHVLAAWRADPDVPRALMLRVVPEAASLGTLIVHSTASGAAVPSLHLTYVPPFRLRQ